MLNFGPVTKYRVVQHFPAQAPLAAELKKLQENPPFPILSFTALKRRKACRP
jgi:hypothetical protein